MLYKLLTSHQSIYLTSSLGRRCERMHIKWSVQNLIQNMASGILCHYYSHYYYSLWKPFIACAENTIWKAYWVVQLVVRPLNIYEMNVGAYTLKTFRGSYFQHLDTKRGCKGRQYSQWQSFIVFPFKSHKINFGFPRPGSGGEILE